MSKHKHIDKICCVILALSILLTVLFMNGKALGIESASRSVGYENRLFDTSYVHTIDIVMDDWDGFIDTCESEEYSSCSIVIDGEAYTGVGIRGKGNTSLSSVSQMNSERYSFKVEFDQYDSTKSYYGLDKLSLNNLIQDNTYMKDYIVYQMMNYFGVSAPLCSFVYITVNGEDWGLYLAVEGVEDSFLLRNYGSDSGELYKPDSLSFGGGRGNGKDFDFDDLDFDSADTDSADSSEALPNGTEDTESSAIQMPDMGGSMPEGFDMSEIPGGQAMGGGFGSMPDMGGEMPEGFDMSEMPGGQAMGGGFGEMPDMGGEIPQMPGNQAAEVETEADTQTESPKTDSDKQSMGMGSSDVKLQYIDDDPDSYSNIFDNAKTDITDADKTRLISSLKTLSSGENIEDAVDIEAVIRYFVVHNFAVNGDSYTGSMIHNYYLYEEDGKLSMIPWDYNLAFGTFMGSDATSSVNEPIDSPVSGGSADDRPMLAWIFENEEYTSLYHQYFSEFIEEYFESGYFAEMIDSVTEMIAPYVEKDPTKFCTYDEFLQGTETIKQFCLLRAESVRGQLDGTIPSTSSGQSADSAALIDASAISISDMGTMGNTMKGHSGTFSQQTVSGSDIPSMPAGTVSQSDIPSFGSGGGKTGGRSDIANTLSGSDISGRKNSSQQDMFSGQFSKQPSGTENGTSALWITLALCAAVLAVAIFIVYKYKR